MTDNDHPLRSLPQVQRLLEMPVVTALCSEFGRAAVTQALRDVLQEMREQIVSGSLAVAPDSDTLIARCVQSLAARRRRGLRRIINATGIVLHTNLGRAPLASERSEEH